MYCKPEVLLHGNTGKPKISIILIDWGVRESFHSLYYLNRQTVSREDYELIWVEFYDHKPEELQRLASLAGGRSVLDKWFVLGYPDDVIFHKHRLYNVGLAAATGDVCVFCDSDAIFRPTFVENVLRTFEETPQAVVHLDKVRNEDYRFYPFSYPSFEEILGLGCVNWKGDTTRGLIPGADPIQSADLEACLAARRRDLLAIGGADEHLDYLGCVSGPYDMTFRLVNHHGCNERWLRNEYLYHVWHPNSTGIKTDRYGPHDGSFMSLRALQARASYRVKPYRKNPLVRHDGSGTVRNIERFLEYLKNQEEPTWKNGAQSSGAPEEVYWVERNYKGFNIFAHAEGWSAVGEKVKSFDPGKARSGAYSSLLQSDSLDGLKAKIDECGTAAQDCWTGSGPFHEFKRKVFAQPLRCLPARAWRKSRRFVSTLSLANRT